jgi:hypothetical protein
MRAVLVVAMLAARPAAAAGPPAETLYIEAGLVVPVDGDPIPGGKIVVSGGKVTDVGKDLERPPFSRRVDARGQTVTPGFVVPMSSIGLPVPPRPDPPPPGSEAPVRLSMTPAAKAADELYPRRKEWPLLLAQGITTVGLLPLGDDPGVPGQSAAVSTKPAPKAADMTLQAEAALVVNVATHGAWREAVEKAFDEAAKAIEKEAAKKDGRAPGTARDEGGKRVVTRRPLLGAGGAMAAIGRPRPAAREKSAPSAKKGEKADGKDEKRSDDPVQRVLKRQERLLLVPHGPAGWVAANDVLPLEDVDLEVVDSADLYHLAKELKDARARVITWPTIARVERTRYPVNRAAIYEAAGVPYAFALPQDSLRQAARLRDAAIGMARTGCSARRVLEALTLEPARALGLADAVGSIKKGARADLLFWSGDPLDPTSRLLAVHVAGEEVEPLPEATVSDAAGGGP